MFRILISFLLLFSYTFYGQTLIERLNAAKQDINLLIQSYDDGTFQILDIADADSQFLNTFQTLQNCFIFVASSKDSWGFNERFINGIYKNNQLRWISDQIMCEAADAFIFDIKDYNNNGTPEIIYTYSWGRGVMTDEDWWIYSWDGTSGNLISLTDENGYTMIKMLGSSARIIDLNSDGILEILGSSNINSDSTLTFSWNGFLYGDWSNGLQARDFYYTTANLFQAKVLSSAIKTTDDTIKYFYSVYNYPSSEQNIQNIYLSIDADSFYSISPPGWECIKWRNEPLVEFVEHNLPADLTPEDFLSGKFRFLETEGVSPGDSITGSGLVSKSLPIIVPYFLRSKSKLVQTSDDLELFLQRYIQDIYENSVSGFTIGPSNVPLPFFSLEFLDSLINYNQRSSELGWISNQVTADKYDSLFNAAKSQLQQNNNNAARTILQTVLLEVDIDSTNNLTSEAYALLRYNTEYLLEQIPTGVELVSTYSIFATHSIKLNQYSVILESGDIGVNDAGLPPFLDPDYELSIGASATTPAGHKVKANRIKLNQNSVINGDIFYNELNNSQGIINGTQTTPLELPLFTELPEFKQSTPGTENITVSNGETRVLSSGSYGNVVINKNGTLVLSGGTYNFNGFTAGQQSTIKYQLPGELLIAGKLDIGKQSNVFASDTTTYSAKDIVFYVGGINGLDGLLGSTPKAAAIGTDCNVKANLYVPNGTLHIKANSEVEGSFIGKDIEIDQAVKVKLLSAF